MVGQGIEGAGGGSGAAVRGAPPRVMAVSSGGGHWVELERIRAAFAGLDVFYVSTDASAAPGLDPVPARDPARRDGAGDGAREGAQASRARHYVIRNVTRRDRWGFVPLAGQILRILWRERPDVVVSTGAAPGLAAIVLAKLFLGARTIWIDTIAAADRPSLSARLARPVADAWLVQWPHLARKGGPDYWGAVV